MDLRQLNALLAVAEHGGFSAAARALHTVQSNVSTHVARLEKELGATLIDRATGRPTKEGEAVLTRATRIRAELEALSSDVASLGARVAGTARLGMIGTTARWLAPLLFEALEEHYPEVRMVLVDATTTSLLPRVDRGDLDLAIVNLPAESLESQAEPLFDEDRILLVPPDHPLGAAPTVALRRAGRPRPAAGAGRARRSGTSSTSRPPPPACGCGPGPRSTACACWPRW